jgi:predicted KAP-like P-loop ATPase
LQSKQHNEDEEAETYIPLEYRDFTPQQLEDLKKITLEKIRQWAEIGRLAEHPKLIPILYAWKEWGNEEECRKFVATMVETDRGILAFLMDTLKAPIDQAISKLKTNAEWGKYLMDIEAFIPLKVLEPHAKILFENPYFERLREREQLALLIFLDLIKAKTTKIIAKTTV